MPAFQVALPVGAYDLNPALVLFTRTGKDGAETIVPIFGGDEYVGEVLEGLWDKGNDGTMHTPITYIAGGSLSMSGHAAVAGVYNYSWMNSKWPIIAQVGTELDIHMELPGHSAANGFGLRFSLGQTNNGVIDPLSATDLFYVSLYTDNAAYSIYLRKSVGGFWSDLAQMYPVEAEGTFRIRFHLNHIHIFYHDGAGAIVESEDECTDSPYTLTMAEVLWPSYQLWSTETTQRSCLSDYVRVTYPDRLRVTYDLAPANNLLGMCHVYDCMGSLVESDWREVYDADHVFDGDCVVQNGLFRLLIDEAAQNGVFPFWWSGAAWTEGYQKYYARLVTSALNVDYVHLVSLVSVTSERIEFRLKFTDSATNNDDYYIIARFTLTRGSHVASISFEEVHPSQNIRAWLDTDAFPHRWAYVGDAETEGIGDDDLGLEATNNTLSDNMIVCFDDARNGDLILYASNLAPTSFYTYQGYAIAMYDIAIGDVLLTRLWMGLLPFPGVDHLFKEAEAATLGGGADTENLADDSGSSARLNAQNETCDYTVIAGTDLPAGRYLAFWRVKDTAQVALDVEFSVYNSTDGAYRNQDNGDTHRVVTAAWKIYQQVFDITAADVVGTDNIRLRIKKDTADANTIYCDYILIVPCGNGESWPMDAAHAAMRSATLDRRIVRR